MYNRNEIWTDISVAKLRGATGQVLWRKNIVGSASNTVWDIEVDATDRVIAAGEVSQATTATQFTVAYFDNTTGQRTRTVELNGTDNWFDVAYDPAVGADGTVVAAGHIINRGPGADFTVVRLD